MPAAVFQLVRVVVWALIAVGLFFGGRAAINAVVETIQAPATLAATRGNLEASKAANDAQTAGVEGLQAAGKARKARSAEAVKNAGKKEFARAKEIAAAPAVGATDYERMVNRIDRELGLQ
jgi:hypothetical protein